MRRAALLVVPAAALLAACTVGSSVPSLSPVSSAGSRTRSAAGSSSGTGASAGSGSSSGALALLGSLAVKGRAPLTGYDRDRFGAAWTDDNDEQYGHNGCDTRLISTAKIGQGSAGPTPPDSPARACI